MRQKRRTYVFSRIHLLNFPLAWLLARFSNVAARVIQLPPRLRALFLLLEYENPDDWNQALEKAFSLSQELVRLPGRWNYSFDLRGNRIDVGPQLLQHLLIEFEGAILTLDLAKRYASSAGQEVRIVESPMMREATSLMNPERLKLVWKLNRSLEGLHESLRMDLRILLSLLRNSFRPTVGSNFEPQHIKTIVRGISSIEYPSKPGELDFSWWIKQGLLVPSSTLFILPTAPQEPRSQALAGVQWISEQGLGSRLKPNEKVHATVKTLFAYIFKSPFNTKSSYRFRLKARSEFWFPFYRRTGIRYLISSLSESWPELPEVSIARSLDARTVNWAYAGSNFSFAKTLAPFADLNLWRSIISADETWTWNPDHTDILTARQLLPKASIETIGPMMCGDPTWLGLSPRKARQKFGLAEDDSVYMAVFDIPVYRKDERAKEGYGPYTLLTTQESLFHACLRALDEFPRLKLLIKRKRLSSPQFETPESLNALLENSSSHLASRIHLIDAKTDPYAVLAMSDLCLATPFTSPVLLSRELGKPSYYFDGAGYARHTFKEAFAPITICDEDLLISRLRIDYEGALQSPSLGENFATLGARVSAEMKKRIQSRLTLRT